MIKSSPRSHAYLSTGESLPSDIVEVVQNIYKEQAETVLSKIEGLPEGAKEKVFALIEQVNEAIKHNTNVFENRMKSILLGEDDIATGSESAEVFLIESDNQ